MGTPILEEATLEKLLKNLKNNKAAGSDGLKGEYYKELGKSEVCKKNMARCLNSVLEEEEAAKSWKESPQK